MARLVASSLSALNKPHMAKSKIKENGKALAMVAVCRAFRPSASNKAIATTPANTDQKIRCQTGEGRSSWEASKSMTRAPESAEVTKNTTTIQMAKPEVI